LNFGGFGFALRPPKFNGQGENVSGLHVETNLQILHGSENQRKGNRA